MSDIVALALLSSILFITNAVTLFWALRRAKQKKSPKTIALERAIAAFESEGITILKIEKINPDHIFLKNPSR